MADKRYQVFVSSTYEDLQDERKEVMQALLELDCIPAGMELFPAADDTQWILIKRVIDDCDYYLVIVGGRYGSTNAEGVSYTEMEYRYALEQSKPIVAFLHKDPSSLIAKRTESSAAGRSRLADFRTLCERKMVKYWASATELGSVVSRSLVRLMKDRPAVGWIRADVAPDQATLEELVKKNKRVEELERKLAATRTEAPPGSERLASGDDTYPIDFTFTANDAKQPIGQRDVSWKGARELSWNAVFAALSPIMIDEAPESVLRQQINALLRDEFTVSLLTEKSLKGKTLRDFRIADDDFQTIKVQLSALGLITKSTRSRSLRDKATYWSLTPYGEQQMILLRAIAKGDQASPDA